MSAFKDWTQADVARFNAKREPHILTPAVGCEEEDKLHYAILEECERRGWIAFHGSTAHRTHRTVGEFDFIILADHGRNFHIECKTRTGKLTEEQQGLQHWARKLGHNPMVVRSFEEFLEVIK